MRLRYIFYGGAREVKIDGSARLLGIAHNNAFFAAAKNVEKDYKSTGDVIKLIKIRTATDLIGEINANQPNQVCSLDILSHGTPFSLNFSIKENENCGIVTGAIAKMLLKMYYSSWEDGIYSFSIQSRYVDDINFSVFSEDARIQIHGCNTARDSLPGDTLTEALSKGLYNAGKKKAYVIGHVSKSNPLINGTSTTNIAQDYRHGKRAIIYNGKVIKVTTKKGIIRHEDILLLIRET